MSEIASKPNTGNNSGLAQPFAKKGSSTEHEVLFAALFGGVVVSNTKSVPHKSEPIPTQPDADKGTELVGNVNILAAMQAVAAMMSNQHSKGQKGESNANTEISETFLDGDEFLVQDGLLGNEESELASIREDGLVDVTGKVDEDNGSAHSLLIGPMPLEQVSGKSLPSNQNLSSLAKMAFDDVSLAQNHAVISKSKAAASLNVATHVASAVSNKKSVDKLPSISDTSDQVLADEVDLEIVQPKSDRRTIARQAIFRPHAYQAYPAGLRQNIGYDSNVNDANFDGKTEFDSPDEFLRAMNGQAERTRGIRVGDVASGDNGTTNAARLALAAGTVSGGQMSHQNNGQSAGQSGNFVQAGSSMTNGSMLEMLDMAQDNWTEMLLQRVEKGLAGGKDKIDFHLNPRNLGKMRISLTVQNDRTNVHIQTDTNAAAQVLSDAEARLAQMMDASGIKLGSLVSQYNQNFGNNFGGQNFRQGHKDDASNSKSASNADQNESTDVEISVEPSENLINMQA